MLFKFDTKYVILLKKNQQSSKRGDHHQPEQMRRMAAAGITGITEMQSAGGMQSALLGPFGLAEDD